MNTKWIYVAVGVLAALVLTFWAGRSSVAVKTVEKIKTVEVEKRVEIESQKLLDENKTLREQNEDLKKHVKVVQIEQKKPDGSSTTTTTTETDEEKISKQTETKTETKTVEVEKKVYVDRVVTVEKEKTVEAAQPNWSVDVMVALKSSRLLADPLYGGSIQHRIPFLFNLPIYGGVFGLYAPGSKEFIGGLSLGGHF